MGKEYRYCANLRLGAALSVLVGFRSSFLGIGGGVVHVPLPASPWVFGAQLGARLSRRLSGRVIQRLLAAGLLGLGVRLVLSVAL